MKILNGGYHKNQVICPDILYHLLHSWPSIHQMSCKYSQVDRSYSNFEFSVVAILNKFNGAYYKNQVICPYIWYDLLYSWPSIHKIPCKYSHVDQSYSNFEFSVAAILKIQNGGRYSSQITCLHFLYNFNNKKLSIHKISCFYDNLNNQATNRSTTVLEPSDVHRMKRQVFSNVVSTPARNTCPLYLVADYRFFQSMGESSIQKTTSYMVGISVFPQ